MELKRCNTTNTDLMLFCFLHCVFLTFTFTGRCIGCRIVTSFRDSRSKGNEIPYNPSNLYKAFKKDNRDILNGKQQDAHEFWLLFMNSINKSCCKKLFELFEHDIASVVVCRNCKASTEIHHKTSEHVIHIRGQTSVQEALKNYFAKTYIEDKLCGVCKKKSAAKKYYLKSIPKCLHLILNRFGNDSKILDDIGLNNQLKIAKYDKDLNQEIHKYKLVSIINHFGTSRYSGHYTAFSRNGICYEFDDAQVSDIFTIDGFNAYMLTYQLSTEVTLFVTKFH